MKRQLNLLLYFLIIISTSCASGGSKFIGQWKPVSSGDFYGRNLLVIEKKGKVYDSYTISAPEKSIRFGYDKKHDYLTGKSGEHQIVIIYLDSTGHIRIVPEKGTPKQTVVLEYEKADIL